MLLSDKYENNASRSIRLRTETCTCILRVPLTCEDKLKMCCVVSYVQPIENLRGSGKLA